MPLASPIYIVMQNEEVNFKESQIVFDVYERVDINYSDDEDYKLFSVEIFLRWHFDVTIKTYNQELDWDVFLHFHQVVSAIVTYVQENWKQLFPQKRNEMYEEKRKTDLLIHEMEPC